ncbi:hypothetical protein D0T53_11895 [Dysgonomonas sp. 216]|uniref:hypothetical protein n=1 Tax=Dysgonomonas sp. 216 TaxID=2302934 RepID=UPI0013D56DC3|nr:hypothetical protein [Dysgonomonas sp. 216]NDW19609.1 hypothetical protein [Dysgonomonas sp. 216]
MNLRERLILYINHLGIAKSEFERTAGLANGFVDKSGDNTRYSSLDKISKSFRDLNIVWLRTGQGDMLLSDSNNSVKSNSNECSGNKSEMSSNESNNDSGFSSVDKLINAVDKLSSSEKINAENVALMTENIKELIAQGRQQTENITKLVNYLCSQGVKKDDDITENKKGESFTDIKGKAELTNEESPVNNL